MTVIEEIENLAFEPLDYDPRYYIHTAKNSITSFVQIIGEVVSNADEAITRRAVRDGGPDEGEIRLYYDPASMRLKVCDDGISMPSATMLARLKKVGAEALEESKRGFFHRGIREVFTAMGGGVVECIAKTDDGGFVYSRAVFDPERGMAMALTDRPVTEDIRKELGVAATGTVVTIPMRRFVREKPRTFEFGMMESEITNCVQVRPVVADPNRRIELYYGSEPARRLKFAYPAGETLVKNAAVMIGGHSATFWAEAADAPVGSGTRKQTRRHGILVRGERAAYEVSVGEKLKTNPAMQQVFGELRLDEIESLQREADSTGNDEAQLIYKPDRSGLNADHPLVEAIHDYIDVTLAPLIAEIERREEKTKSSPDVRRQLAKLAQLINQTIKDETLGSIETPDGIEKSETERGEIEGDPPERGEYVEPVVDDGLAFAYGRIFIPAGEQRIIKLYVDTDKIASGTEIALVSQPDEIVRSVTLSRSDVPDVSPRRIGEIKVTIQAASDEGRHEVTVAAGAYTASLPVHVRFQRASGFISQIVLDQRDWSSGSALYDPATGRVTVYVGRPEFQDAAARARREKVNDSFTHPLYRELVVESVREAALWPAARRRAEVEFDELSPEERTDRDAFMNLVITEFYALDYALRAKLLKVFLNGAS